ncbi:hypothetical protein Gotur_032417 [Gossypium turneri]
MERQFLGKVKDNAAVRVWFEKVQQAKGDSYFKPLRSTGIRPIVVSRLGK